MDNSISVRSSLHSDANIDLYFSGSVQQKPPNLHIPFPLKKKKLYPQAVTVRND